MNNEQKSEIIKSLAFEMPLKEIAENEDVSVSEVEQIAYDCGNEIARIKQFYTERDNNERS